MVSLSLWSLKILQMCFFMLSISFGVLLRAANSSPLYSPNKHICKIFNDHKLKLTIEANKKCVDYLDITLDLKSGTYKPFTKLRNIPKYVNRHSNHPPSILRSIPEAINRRLTNISSDKQSFDAAIPPYQALKKVAMISSSITTHSDDNVSDQEAEIFCGLILCTALTLPQMSSKNFSRQTNVFRKTTL